MPQPRNEREAWERERGELQVELASYQATLDDTPATDTAQHERLTWHLRRIRLRLEKLAEWLGEDSGRPAPARVLPGHFLREQP